VTISKPLTILSDHAVINVAAGKKGFVVASDNVTISGLTIIGAQSTPNDDEARGIDATGALATYYKNIRVINNTIKTFAGYGIYSSTFRISTLVRTRWKISTTARL
jgi:hypothetical protein